jgi:hypothetical protein
MIVGEKIELKVYVNQHDFVSDIQTPSRSWFLLCFLHEILMRGSWLFFKNLNSSLIKKLNKLPQNFVPA